MNRQAFIVCCTYFYPILLSFVMSIYCFDNLKSVRTGDFPGGPGAKTALSMQGARVQSLIRKLDPTCCNYDSVPPNKSINIGRRESTSR